MEAVLDKIQKEYNLTERQRKLLQFSFLGIIYDVTKIGMLFVFFACIQQIPAFLFNLVLLILLRTNQGGLHLKNFISCFLFSFAYLFLAICILPMLVPDISTSLGLCILFLCMIIIYKIGPQKNLKIYTKLKDSKNVIRSKYNSILICFAFIFLYFIFSDIIFFKQGMWLIVLHTMQIVFVTINKKRKEINKWSKNYMALCYHHF